LATSISPQRFGGITLINNEADEKVGFEVPYAPRMDHRGAAWQCASIALTPRSPHVMQTRAFGSLPRPTMPTSI
jgi:hypothetical protein